MANNLRAICKSTIALVVGGLAVAIAEWAGFVGEPIEFALTFICGAIIWYLVASSLTTFCWFIAPFWIAM